MSTIATELTRILNAKAALITAINEKGGSLTSSSKLEDFASEVESIQTGGSVEIPSGTCFCHSTWSTLPLFVLDYMKTLTIIPEYFFSDCSKLTSVTIPSSVTSIEYRAFYSCIALTSITIPSSVTHIKKYAFFSCKALTSITIPSLVTSIEESTFHDCVYLQTVNLSDTLLSIGEDSFRHCYRLTSITIPSTITSIGHCAFYDCSGLTSVTILATTPPTLIGTLTFSGYNSTYPIYVPAESVDTYKAATNWSSYADRIQAIPTENE